MPKRIQKKRGVKLPKGCIYCGRPTRWGNKFKVGKPITLNWHYIFNEADFRYYFEEQNIVRDKKEACRLFKKYQLPSLDFHKEQLKEKDLACWCKLTEKNCHVEILLKWANK